MKTAITLAIVLTLTTGALFSCGQNSDDEINHELLRRALNEYIKTDMTDFAAVTHPDGELFADFYLMGWENDSAGLNCYLWVYCQEYFPENNNIEKGMGVSCPVALSVIHSDGCYHITGHQVPRDGSLYGEDMRRIFPPDLCEYRPDNAMIEILSGKVKNQAEEYFQTLEND